MRVRRVVAMHRSTRPSALTAAILCLAVGCSGGSSDPPPFAPEASIVYPWEGIVPPGPLTVRGTATPSVGTAIAEVTVNGVSAISTDGFATWTADLSLDPGDQLIEVDVVDTRGRGVTAVASTSVRASHQPRMIRSPVFHSSGDVFFLDRDLGDPSADAVFRLDLESGIIELISAATSGSGLPQNPWGSMALLSDGDLAVAVTLPSGVDAIMRVDPVSGVRTILSGDGTGAGPPLIEVVDVARGRPGKVLVHVRPWPAPFAILEVDIATGDRVEVFSWTYPQLVGPFVSADDGTVFFYSQSPPAGLFSVAPGSGVAQLVLLPSGHDYTGLMVETPNTILAAGSNLGVPGYGVYRVDVVTGVETPLASLDLPVASPSLTAEGIVSFASLALSLYALDVDLGSLTRIHRPARGTGPLIEGFTAAAELPDGTFAYLELHGDVTRIDPRTGDRSMLSAATSGPVGLFTLVATDTALFSSSNSLGLTSIDIATGARTPIPLPFSGWKLAAEPGGTILVAEVTTFPGRLHRVDPDTGAWTTVSGGGVGSGPDLPTWYMIEIELLTPDVLLVLSNQEILSVDLVTGDRTILSTASQGPPLGFGVGVGELAVVEGRILNGAGGIISEVDPVTGNRTQIVDLTPHPFTVGSPPMSVFMFEMLPLSRDQLLVPIGLPTPSAACLVDLPTGQWEIIAR